jgi:hypothetical protein
MKSRGIEINIVTQHDIAKLPEYKPPSFTAHVSDPPVIHIASLAAPSPPRRGQVLSPTTFAASICIIPILPSSQIWLEYTIDGPHPPNASYLFRLSVNGRDIVSWDCTRKHGWCGKMMYVLSVEQATRSCGYQPVKRLALRFGDNGEDDVLEVKVFRIEKRVRIRDISEVGRVDAGMKDGLKLTNSGFIEPGTRMRRYKYQLLDPKDTPYAAFLFLCRSPGQSYRT